MTFAAVYAVVVGIAMIGHWAFSLARNQVPELQTEPIRIRFHLAAEFVTAAALLAGGSGLLLDCAWGLNAYLVSIGMLAVLLVLAVVSLGLAL